MPNPPTKFCRGCNKQYPFEEFVTQSGRDGHYCRECRKVVRYNQKRREKNK